jgi:hypothetical protein
VDEGEDEEDRWLKEKTQKQEVDEKINADSTLLSRSRSENDRQQEAPLP